MKEFERWFEETYPLPSTMERGPIGRDLKNGCKNAWQTVLKWVLNHTVYDPNDRGEDYGIIPDISFIEEELGDEE